MKNLHKTLDLMIEHNERVDINNFFLKYMNMTWYEFKNLPKPSTYCTKHLEENCIRCQK